ncbi:MAG TPA: bifunctional methylenetetrahydrofolate dehydrogenase/methenyltetrahydrofolate cyclohydrolase FolD [Rhodospirillaceae bacterium]|nr:bifunctional methylenetetrahydrofolate dehydrogenase/methenyltetrahydrofolate cyclohydrolase FolD [Rhodospirillaceae bacterium]|tara:strand:+ start:558 stop:1448 length:891 start_codon:yes stop_codon:yes gene_type:complete
MSDNRIIDGKAFAAGLRERVAVETDRLKADHGIVPGLAAVLVGEDPASQVYVRNKNRQMVEAGMLSLGETLPEDTTQADLLAVIDKLNADPAVNGILVQLPLPSQIDPNSVIDAIDPAKDVDGFHLRNAGLLATGRDGMVPCTPLGCRMLLEDRLGDLTGLNAVIVGRSNIVGKPMAQLLLDANCTVTVAHSRTDDLPEVCREADILVVAVGRPQMIKGDWIKPGGTVIDVGINRVPGREEGKTRLVGDVDFEAAVEYAGGITPVPGGVGPMTIACLLRNTLVAACRQNGVEVLGI